MHREELKYEAGVRSLPMERWAFSVFRPTLLGILFNVVSSQSSQTTLWLFLLCEDFSFLSSF